MRYCTVFLLFVVVLIVRGDPGLWPLPQKLTTGTTDVNLLQNSFTFIPTGYCSDILEAAVKRYMPLVFFTPPPVQLNHQKDYIIQNSILEGIDINVLTSNETLSQETDESYTLTVSSPRALLTANTVFGALRGLETFSQLVEYDTTYRLYVVHNTPVVIQDFPRFNFRGLLVDTARHYLPLQLLLDNLDALAYNKMNVMHWHVVDDQSFPFESSVYPLLSQKGAYQFDHVYSASDVKLVIEEGRLRGIRVVPEFDTPGHTQSWGKGYPFLLTDCSPSGKGPINPILNTTYDFLTHFFGEVAGLFTDEYVHLGGDEVSFDCWKSNPDIQNFMKKQGWSDYSKLEQYYELNLLNIVGARLNELGKEYIVWQEIFNNGIQVKPQTVIDVWKGTDFETMKRATEKGLRVVLSGCWYLDHLTDTWDAYYTCEPLSFKGTEAQYKLVMGGHASMWGEHVDAANFMSRIWPRASAVGERLWSAKDVTDVSAAAQRLHIHRCRMVNRDVPADSIGPGFCPNELTYP